MDIDAPDNLSSFPNKLFNDGRPPHTKRKIGKGHHGGRPSKRQNILQFAIELAEEQGPKGFTIDALCERSGISKGGIFYHFASVNELVQEMFVFYLDTQLPQWLKSHSKLTSLSSQKIADMSVNQLTYLVEHAPVNANLERLVFKVTIESAQPPRASSFLHQLIAAASPTETISLYSVFGSRIARVFELPDATHGADIADGQVRQMVSAY